MPRTIFSIVSFVVSVYALMCFLRILLTWVPSLSYSRFSRFLGKICDPYLNIFRGIKWLRLGSFDFSAALGLCILGVLATMLSRSLKCPSPRRRSMRVTRCASLAVIELNFNAE